MSLWLIKGASVSIKGQRSVKFQFRFHLFPRYARFTGIAFHRAAKLDEIFDVFETLLKPAHLGSKRL